MEGAKHIHIDVKVDSGKIFSCTRNGDSYAVCMNTACVNGEMLTHFFKCLMQSAGTKPESADVHFTWQFDHSFIAANEILHAVARAGLEIWTVLLMGEKEAESDFWQLLASLPPCIREARIGRFHTQGQVPVRVWSHLPRLQSIRAAADDEEFVFPRPELTISKRKRKRVDKDYSFDRIDIQSSSARFFVLLPDGCDDDREKRFNVPINGDKHSTLNFKAIPYESVPNGDASKMVEWPAEVVKIGERYKSVFRHAYATKNADGVEGAMENGTASGFTGKKLHGRVVIVRE